MTIVDSHHQLTGVKLVCFCAFGRVASEKTIPRALKLGMMQGT